jgi:small subunit ribosomal protein S6
MVRDYELMYIVRPELDDDGLQAATRSVETLIDGVGGTVVRSTSWGRRRLAYEVDHLRDGHYMLLHLRVDGARITEIERALTIHDTVFRHLLVLHEAGAEIEAVDPDTVPPTAVAVAADEDDDDVDAGEVEEDDVDAGEVEEDDVDAGEVEEDDVDAGEPVASAAGRQTAVAPASDDEPDEAGTADEDPAAVSATTTEEEN